MELPPTPPADELYRFTVSRYFEDKGVLLDLNKCRAVGQNATAAYRRAHRGDPPPKVKEWHVGLGGWVEVGAYPPPLGPQILENALAEVREFERYEAPPPPPM
jgi:hypothetical protein